MTDLQTQISALHRQMARANEAEHLLFLDGDGAPLAMPVWRVIGIYKAPSFEDLAEDILHACPKKKRKHKI